MNGRPRLCRLYPVPPAWGVHLRCLDTDNLQQVVVVMASLLDDMQEQVTSSVSGLDVRSMTLAQLERAQQSMLRSLQQDSLKDPSKAKTREREVSAELRRRSGSTQPETSKSWLEQVRE